MHMEGPTAFWLCRLTAVMIGATFMKLGEHQRPKPFSFCHWPYRLERSELEPQYELSQDAGSFESTILTTWFTIVRKARLSPFLSVAEEFLRSSWIFVCTSCTLSSRTSRP